MNPVISETNFPGLKLRGRGKVRDIYEVGDKLLIVATDRLSAFDVVLPTPIPDKGKVLTQLSLFWFEKLKDVVPNHIIASKNFGGPLRELCRRARRPHDAGSQDRACAGRVRGARIHFRLGVEGLPEDRRNLRDSACRRGCASPISCPSRFSRLRRKRRPATTKTFRSTRR